MPGIIGRQAAPPQREFRQGSAIFRAAAALRGCFTRGLRIVPRHAWPAAAGSRWAALQAANQLIRPHAAAEGRAACRSPAAATVARRCDHDGPSLPGLWMARQAFYLAKPTKKLKICLLSFGA